MVPLHNLRASGACAVGALAVLFAAAPGAQAQTVLVSNTDDPGTTGSSAYRAQAFTTGSQGATLTDVQIHFRTGATQNASVVIREDDNGAPGDLVATLTNPASFVASALNTFTAPADTTLDAGTTYWVSVHEGVSGRWTLSVKNDNDETGESGWTISNASSFRNSEAGNWVLTGSSLVMAVRGTLTANTTTPSIDSMAFTNLPTAATLGIGAVIELTATFSEAVTVDTTGGTPRVALSPALGPNGETRHADYVSGSGSTALVFRYTVVEGDDARGLGVSVRIAADSLELNGGTIGAGTAAASLTHTAVDSGKQVYTKRGTVHVGYPDPGPTVDADLDGEPDTFTTDAGNEAITVKVVFENVGLLEVDTAGSNANVRVVLDIGGTEVALDYLSSSGAEAAFGTHTVVATNVDSDGVVLKRDGSGNVIRLSNGATVKASELLGGNDVVLTAAADVAVNVTAFPGAGPVRVRGTNAAPTGSDFTGTTPVDTDLTFAKADFAIADGDGDPLKEIRIATLPASEAGELKLAGTTIASTDLPQTVTHGDLDGGRLVFDPVSTYNGDASFTFNVVDPFDAVAAAVNTATITVGSGTAPGAPGAPTVETRSSTRLLVSWSEPSSLGSAASIADYDLRYFAGAADPTNEADWVEEGETDGPPDPGTATSATITGLTAGTAYRVQVRAAGDGLEGPWSASGSGTPMNRAPRVLEFTGQAIACRVKTDLSTPAVTINASNTLVSVGPLVNRGADDTGELPAACLQGGVAGDTPIFDDLDGDELTIAFDFTRPDDVRSEPNLPAIFSNNLWYEGVAARGLVEFRVDLTATDPSGASVATHVIFRVTPPGDTGPPTFGESVDAQTWTVNQAITDLVLPAASGGDLGSVEEGGVDVPAFDYEYAVSGLPAGLSFDAGTRTISGTPTMTGSSTVTYTAADVDENVADADRASLTFTIRIRLDVPPGGKELVDQADGCGETACPDAPTGYAAPGPGHGEITATWTPATTGGAVASWDFKVKEDGTDIQTISSSNAAERSRTFSSLDPAKLYGIVVQGRGSGAEFGDAALATGVRPMDAMAPTFSSAAVNGTELTVTFSEDLDSTSAPAGSAFTVSATPSGGTARTINGTGTTGIAGATATVTLADAVVVGETVTASYAAPATDPLQNAAGSDVADFSDQPVTNNTAAPVLVSNIGQPIERERRFADLDSAQGFTTGSSSYTLASVDVSFGNAPGNGLRVQVRRAGPDGSLVATLTNPSSMSSGINRFTAQGGAPLAAGTTYYVVLDSTSVGSVNTTSSDAEDGGGVSGWSLDDHSFVRGSGSWAGHVEALRIRVRGRVEPDTTAPAFQSAAVRGTELTVTFSEDLDPGSAPAGSAFTVRATPSGGTARTINGKGTTGIDVATATVTLADAVVAGETVTVSYAAPASDPLQDAAANAVADFSDQAATNNTAPVLVSNIGRTQTATNRFLDFALAQGFTAGSSGAALTSVDVKFDSAPGTDLRVQVRRSAPDGTVVATLTNPSSMSSGINTFTAQGVVALAAGARYVVVLDSTTMGSWGETTDGDEDPGGKSGWSVDDEHFRGIGGQWPSASNSLLIRLRGVEAPPDTTAPAFQNAAVRGTELTVAFSEDLDSTSAPAGSAFTVRATPSGGTARTINGTGTTGIAGATATVTLGDAVVVGETVTVSYTAPASDPLQDAAVNAVADFSDLEAVNATGWLVSNVSQAAGDRVPLDADHAQSFTAGVHAPGYELTGVGLNFEVSSGSPPSFTVKVLRNDASLDLPDADGEVGTLRQQGDLPDSAGSVQFLADGDGLDLTAGQRYWVAVDVESGASATTTMETTNSRDEDAGNALGWVIRDVLYSRGQGETTWQVWPRALKLTVYGREKTTSPGTSPPPPGDGGDPPPDDGGDPPPGDGGDPPPGDGGDPPPDDGGDPPPDDGEDPPGGRPTAAFSVDVPCPDGLCRARTGEAIVFSDTSSGTVARRSWDFDVGARSAPSGATVRHAWSSPGFYEVTLTVSGAGVESTTSRVFLIEAADPAGTCEPDSETICLQDSRYLVRGTWRSPEGQVQPARVAHAGTNDSGLLWFHNRENWEALVKVLDGCAINGADWVFAASATTLEYDIEVTDTVTGQVRLYGNEPGRQAEAVTDTDAFTDRCANKPVAAAGSTVFGAGNAGDDPLSMSPRLAALRAGAATSPVLLLHEGRFEVAAEWSMADGRRGEARPARAATADSGLFWFFDPDNWEVLIKVLNGCAFNGHYWVFGASATDVGLDITVTDTTTGDVRRYTKSPGAPAPALADIAAFRNSCNP